MSSRKKRSSSGASRKSSKSKKKSKSVEDSNQARVTTVIETLNQASEASQGHGNGGALRGPNFSPEEDTCLGRCFVMTSQDPRYGTDRSADHLWQGIVELMAKEGYIRTIKSARARWGTVRPLLSDFSSLVSRIRGGRTGQILLNLDVEIL